MTTEDVKTEAETKSRPRRRAWARALVVLASIIAFAAILSIWANRQILNTDNWTTTSTRLLENRQIRDQLAGYLVDQLYANVDVAGELREALPERLQPLAGPAAGGLREFADRAARRMLSRPAVQERWAQANRAAQEQLLKVLEGGGPVVSTTGGTVVLDLTELLNQVQQRVGIGGRVADRLPASAAQITILHSDELETAQDGLKVVKGLPFILVGLSLLLFGAALAISPGWRRQALRAYGIGFVLAGAAALLVQDQAGQWLVNALADTASVEPAIAATWTISTTLLVEAAWATIGYGVFMVLAAWIAGPSRPTVAIRRAVAPYASHLGIAYAHVGRARRAAALVGADAGAARPGPGADPDRAAGRRLGGAPAPDRPRASRTPTWPRRTSACASVADAASPGSARALPRAPRRWPARPRAW